MRKFSLSAEKRHKLEGVIFISPFLLGTLLFFIFPLYISIRLSFGKLVKIDGFVIKLIGLDNYVRAFVIDANFVPMFLEIIRKTIIQVPLIIIFSLLLAILVNKNIKIKGFLRTVYFIPFLLGTGDVMKQLLDMGIDKHIISLVGSNLLPREFLAYLGPKVVEAVDNFFGVIVVVLWSSGVQILLFLSGLQSIPASLYESAKVDGANEWEMFWKITLPMISPIMLLIIVYSIITSFTDINNPMLSYIQSKAFQSLQFEYAAAMGWIYFMFIILLVSAVFILFRNYIYSTSGGKGAIRNERKDF